MGRAFVIRPFGKKKDSSGREIDFDRVHGELITPALEANDLDGSTTGEIVEAGNIREDMFALILEADVVICDITVHNANVFYEVGIRHALRKKSTIMIKGDPTEDKTPFDLLTDRYFSYRIDAPRDSTSALETTIRNSMNSNRPTDSPIFQMVPGLAEADPEKVQIVPPDLLEEAQRAGAARSRGWLRLLSDEVAGRRFERSALKLIGQAQWDLTDFDAAVSTWERIRTLSPADIDANLALANLFERQSRDPSKTPEQRARLLASSDHAIERVLGNESADRAKRAEALALKGRNQKTHWREGLMKATTPADSRRLALKGSLIDSYDSYKAAFEEDLNAFYPGVAAVQMGTKLQSLSAESGWKSIFKNDREARNYREDLEEKLPTLASAVSMSIASALKRNARNRWAVISDADMQFLTSDSDDRVINAYVDAFTGAAPFDWNATKGQLQLFASLGIKPERAQAAIDEVGKVLGDNPTAAKPLHVVVFAGHQFDEPGRQTPRLPVAHRAAAAALIKASMQDFVGAEHDLVLLGSVSPGADILWHEACAQLGLTSTVCLPMPAADHGRVVFGSDDAMRSRFLDIIAPEQKRVVLTLSDRPGLPKWLVETRADPFMRANAWVIKMANSLGAQRVTLLAFWDGQEAASGSAGTASLVNLARNEGNIRIVRIDSTQVLAT